MRIAVPAILLALGCTVFGCSRREGAEHRTALEAERLCASACAPFAAASCPRQVDEPTEARQAACVAACVRAAAVASMGGCAEKHAAYLGCVSALGRACAPPGLTPGTALENAAGVSACASEHAAYFRCTEPCRDRGAHWTRSATVTHEGRARSAQAELVSAGCTSDAAPREKKSDPGAPCTHFSVCTAASCECPRKGVRYRARACVDGVCADARLACSLAPSVVLHDPCPKDGH